MQQSMPIPQNLNALPPQSTLHGIRAYPKIVIAQHGDHTGARPKSAQDFRHRLNRRSRIGYEIAGKRHQVGLEPVAELHHRRHMTQRHKQAVMNIAELKNAETAKSLRQFTQPDALRGYAQAAAESMC